MIIKPFSCIRPAPEHIGEILSLGDISDKSIAQAHKEQLLTLDISRALYLYAYSDGQRTWKSLIACMEAENEASPAHQHYQSTPVRVSFPSNIALDIILSAATGAVPLYNIQNGTQQIVVWRISRAEALGALEATFETLSPIGELALPYKRTVVALCDENNADMPAIPAGLFSHVI